MLFSMSVYSEDMGQTLDFISSKMGTNPHLPEKRKLEPIENDERLKTKLK